MITASDVASVIGMSRYESPEDVMYKKCGFSKKYNERSITSMSHGVQYESVARDLYCKLTGEIVHEVGLVQHPEYSFIGASADGITESGKVIEIKCPTGKLRTEIPDYYYPQVQLCMEVLNLDTCDYMEFQLPDTLNIFSIPRDKDWFMNNLPIIETFWNNVVDRRKLPLCEIVTPESEQMQEPELSQLEQSETCDEDLLVVLVQK